MPQRDGSAWGTVEKQYQSYVYNFFKDKGYPTNAIFGLMGNASQESDWQPFQNESGGTAFGLWQWDGERKVALQNYGTDLYHQCMFLDSEITGNNTSETGAEYNWINANGYTHDNFMNGTYSPSDSASAFCWCWERPNASLANEAYRRSEADSFASEYGTGGSSSSQQVENAVTWMINIANDDSHGYDQTNRWGADYDCSSFVISGYEQAGIPLKSRGATYTGDMKQVALETGFSIVDWNNDVSKLVRGDIILNETHHVCCYIGNGQIVQASINELGTTTGGQTGDQTGKEIYVRDFYTYKYGWDCVLRYGSGAIGGNTGGQTGGTGGVPSDDKFGDDYFDKYERYFIEYDDLSEVYKKMKTTPYIFNQLSSDFIKFLRTLNFNDNVHMKFTFDHNKRYIGTNFLGNKLTFDNNSYIIIDVKNDGFLIINNGGNVCYNFINPKQIYQTDEEKAETKSKNVEKIKQHIQDEIEQAHENDDSEEV
jgi:cell wall-associated NlpC family hydrolase